MLREWPRRHELCSKRGHTFRLRLDLQLQRQIEYLKRDLDHYRKEKIFRSGEKDIRRSEVTKTAGMVGLKVVCCLIYSSDKVKKNYSELVTRTGKECGK